MGARECEVNEAVLATYLAGGSTRRLRGALAPLLKAAPPSKSAVGIAFDGRTYPRV